VVGDAGEEAEDIAGEAEAARVPARAAVAAAVGVVLVLVLEVEGEEVTSIGAGTNPPVKDARARPADVDVDGEPGGFKVEVEVGALRDLRPVPSVLMLSGVTLLELSGESATGSRGENGGGNGNASVSLRFSRSRWYKEKSTDRNGCASLWEWEGGGVRLHAHQ
jgi:hypothetical protein